MQSIILVIHLVLAISLVVVILMQRSEGGAANLTGGGGGGGMGGFMSVRGASNFLTRLTTYLAIAFISTSLILAFFAGSEAGPSSLMDEAAPLVPAEETLSDEPVEPAVPSVPLSE